MSDQKAEKWLGFRQEAGGTTYATFAMPSGRIREVPIDRDLMFKAIQELARALRFSEPRA